MKFISSQLRVLILVLLFLGFITSCQKEKKDYFDLKKLPKHWVKLTKMGGELVVFNSCDNGNLLLTISKKTDKYKLLLHGQQEDSEFEIIESFRQNDTIIIKAKLEDSEEKQIFKFSWLDKNKGIGHWITTYSNDFTLDYIFVEENNQISFKKVEQPCRECWGEECDEAEKNIAQIDKPIVVIKRIFNNYIEYEESTDTFKNKELMSESLKSLTNIETQEDLELLINVWMYYDPTDYPSIPEIYRILKDSRPTSIESVKNRIRNKKKWETDDTAPYSDLKGLLKRLENE